MYSHSASDGSLPPIQLQNSLDWYQFTQLMGCFSRPSTPQLQFCPVPGSVHFPALRHERYWPTVASERITWYPRSFNFRAGIELRFPADVEPIRKFPRGSSIHTKLALFVCGSGFAAHLIPIKFALRVGNHAPLLLAVPTSTIAKSMKDLPSIPLRAP